jgi:hypothetical protein
MDQCYINSFKTKDDHWCWQEEGEGKARYLLPNWNFRRNQNWKKEIYINSKNEKDFLKAVTHLSQILWSDK